MSYETDKMESLTYALRNSDGLKYAIRQLNDNMPVLERLAASIERNNELIEMQLGIREIDKNVKVKSRTKDNR